MTYLYEWGTNFPEKTLIKCPQCQKEASFQFAKQIWIKEKKHIPSFEKSPYFTYLHTNSMNWRHYALYQPAFFGKFDKRKITTLGDFANDYDKLTSYRSYRHGAYVCSHCLAKKRHELVWYADAYYQTNIRGHLLWAFNKAHLIAIRDFVKSNERKEKAHDFTISLYQLPTVFKSKKIREDVLKAIDKLLTS